MADAIVRIADMATSEAGRRCSRCREVKPRDQFGKHPKHKDGLQSACRECYARAAAERRRAHPERHRESARKSRVVHREKMLEATRKWRRENKAFVRERRRVWEAKNPDKVKLIYLRKRAKLFGLTAEQYLAMHAAQGGCCAICRKPEAECGRRRFGVDHDHETGAVRALLCGPCNSLLGLARDDIAVLECAIAYLLDHAPKIGKVA